MLDIIVNLSQVKVLVETRNRQHTREMFHELHKSYKVIRLYHGTFYKEDGDMHHSDFWL